MGDRELTKIVEIMEPNKDKKTRIRIKIGPGVHVTLDEAYVEYMQKNEDLKFINSYQTVHNGYLSIQPEAWIQLSIKYQKKLDTELKSKRMDFETLLFYLLNHQKSITVQQGVCLELYSEIIEFCTSAIFLDLNHRTTGIKTLIRAFIERIVYLSAVSEESLLANSYLLQAELHELENKKLRFFYGSFEHLYKDADVEMTLDPKYQKDLEAARQAYKACFKPGNRTDKWYNLDGKTNTIEDLVKRYGISKHLKHAYADHSMEVHSGRHAKPFEELFMFRESEYREGVSSFGEFITLIEGLKRSEEIVSRIFNVEKKPL
jgi:hypothetical protein